MNITNSIKPKPVLLLVLINIMSFVIPVASHKEPASSLPGPGQYSSPNSDTSTPATANLNKTLLPSTPHANENLARPNPKKKQSFLQDRDPTTQGSTTKEIQSNLPSNLNLSGSRKTE